MFCLSIDGGRRRGSTGTPIPRFHPHKVHPHEGHCRPLFSTLKNVIITIPKWRKETHPAEMATNSALNGQIAQKPGGRFLYSTINRFFLKKWRSPFFLIFNSGFYNTFKGNICDSSLIIRRNSGLSRHLLPLCDAHSLENCATNSIQLDSYFWNLHLLNHAGCQEIVK